MQTGLTVPLSPAQELLCRVEEVAPGTVFGSRFVAVGAYRVSGPLDVAVLRASLDDLVVRHEALRTVTVRDGPSPYQKILPPAPARLAVVAADRVMETAFAGDYPATAAPLMWAFLGRHSGADATLVLVVHHTVSDPWSMRLLMADLMSAYADRVAGAAPRVDAPRYADSTAAARRRYDERRCALLTPYARELPLASLLSALPEAARFFAPGGPVSAQFEVIALPATVASPLAYRPVRLPGPVPLGGPVLPVNGMAVWLDPGGGYTGTVRYRSDLFAPSTVDEVTGHYVELLDALVRP
jgi:hypothetical protein